MEDTGGPHLSLLSLSQESRGPGLLSPTPSGLPWTLLESLGALPHRAGREAQDGPPPLNAPSLSASGRSTPWPLPSVSAAGCAPTPSCTASL